MSVSTVQLPIKKWKIWKSLDTKGTRTQISIQASMHLFSPFPVYFSLDASLHCWSFVRGGFAQAIITWPV